MPSKYTMTVMIFIMMVSFYYFARHVCDFSLFLSHILTSVITVLSVTWCSLLIFYYVLYVFLSFISSQVEKLARTLFLWKIEVHEQKEKVYEMRRWNEALVTNMLPEHVARHFLGSKKRDEVRNVFSMFEYTYSLNKKNKKTFCNLYESI